MTNTGRFSWVYVTVVAVIFLDTVSVYLGRASIFNKFSLIVLSFVILKGIRIIRKYYFKFVFLFLVLLMLINIFRFGFNQKDLYDISQIGLSSCFLMICSKINVKNFNFYKISPGVILFAITCVLFLPSFFNVNFGAGYDFSESSSFDIESLRGYYSGLFSVPQVPAYFFYYFSLYCLYKLSIMRSSSSRMIWILFFVFSTIFCLIVGSRTPFYTSLILYIVYVVKSERHSWLLNFSILLIIFFFIVNIELVLRLTSDTFLFQYFSFVKTLIWDWERLSRTIIWSSWFAAMSDFGVLDWIVGHGFDNSFSFNDKYIGLRIWFHSDFFSIIYSWGLVGLFVYSYPYFIFYKKFKWRISSSPLMFVSFYSMIVNAAINGFYYYYSIVIIYLMYEMLSFDDGVHRKKLSGVNFLGRN